MPSYHIFGETISGPLMLAFLGVVATCLLAFRLRTVLLLTLIALFLPSLDIPQAASLSRLLRWAFLAGLIGKGILVNARHGFRARPSTREHRLLLAFAALILVSAAWSIGSEISLAQGGVLLMMWMGVYLILWNSWGEADQLIDLCQILFQLAAFLFVIEGIYQVLGIGRTGSGPYQRYYGAFRNPNSLGTAVAFLGPFVYWKHRTSASAGMRLFTKALGLVMLSGLILSGSRSGLLGSIVCMGVIVTYVHRARVAVTLAFVVPPLILLAVLAPKLDTQIVEENAVSSRIIRADTLSNLSDRVELWERGFDLYLDRPFLGYGFGMSKFAEIGRANFDLFQAMIKTGNLNYHSTYLQVALDLGIVGVALFVFFAFSTLFRGFRVFRRGEHSSLELGGMAFYGAFLALFGDTFVHGWAFSPGNSMAIVFWLVSAAVIRVDTLLQEADSRATARDESEWGEEGDLSPVAVRS